MQIHPSIVSSRKFGDFDILFQYVNEEPAMVIRAHRFLHSRLRAWVVMQEAAWKYVDNVENPASGHSAYMVHASAKISEMLGLSTDLQTRFRIAEAIQDCLEELINMKPMKIDQPSGGQVEGVMTVGDERITVSAELEGDTVNSTEGYRPVAPHPSELSGGNR